MSRMHKGSKGRSGSHRVNRERAPEWQGLAAREVEETIVKLAREGKTGAQIGILLRDQYGVPDVQLATGKRMAEILDKNGVAPQIPEDLQALIKTSVSLQNHLAVHRKDLHNARGLQLVESKIRRLARYYKQQQRIPLDWTYTTGGAQLMVE